MPDINTSTGASSGSARHRRLRQRRAAKRRLPLIGNGAAVGRRERRGGVHVAPAAAAPATVRTAAAGDTDHPGNTVRARAVVGGGPGARTPLQLTNRRVEAGGRGRSLRILRRIGGGGRGGGRCLRCRGFELWHGDGPVWGDVSSVAHAEHLALVLDVQILSEERHRDGARVSVAQGVDGVVVAVKVRAGGEERAVGGGVRVGDGERGGVALGPETLGEGAMTPPSAEARMAPTGESNRHPTAAGLSPRAAEVTVRFARPRRARPREGMAPARRGPRAEADAKAAAPRLRDPSRRRAAAAGTGAREARAEADARATAPAALIRASRMSRGGRGARARRRRARVRVRRPLAETRGTVPPV